MSDKKSISDIESLYSKHKIRKVNVNIKFYILIILFIFMFFASFSVGRYHVPIKNVIEIIYTKLKHLIGFTESAQIYSDEMALQMQIVVLNVRLPRIIAAVLIGGALCVAGSVYQGMFNNPMVSPDILGTSSGACFGAAIAILYNMTGMTVSLFAFIFGLVATFVTIFTSSRFRGNQILGLVLSGIVVGSLFTAGTSFIKLVADSSEQLPAITYWLLGSLSGIKNSDLVLITPIVLLGFILLMCFSWRLNIITLGDDDAYTLGVNAKLYRIIAILITTLMISSCVAVSGMIGWIGLIIPNLSRRIFGSDFKKLIPASFIFGGAFMLLTDNISRALLTSEIPIGILTAFIGTPFFLFILVRGTSKMNS